MYGYRIPMYVNSIVRYGDKLNFEYLFTTATYLRLIDGL